MSLKLLYAPDEAILNAKKDRKIAKSIAILLVATLILLATILVSAYLLKIPIDKLIFFDLMGMKFSVVMWAFIIVFGGGLFLGLILLIVMNILGGNGDYFDGVTSVSYFLLPLSIGIFISSVINFAPLKITDINLMILKGLIIFAIGSFFTAEAVAILYKSVKELFETDMVGALIGIGLIGAAIALPFYIMMFQSIFGIFGGLLGSSLPFGSLGTIGGTNSTSGLGGSGLPSPVCSPCFSYFYFADYENGVLRILNGPENISIISVTGGSLSEINYSPGELLIISGIGTSGNKPISIRYIEVESGLERTDNAVIHND